MTCVTHGRSLASERSEHPSDADADDADGEQSEEMDSWPRGFFGVVSKGAMNKIAWLID